MAVKALSTHLKMDAGSLQIRTRNNGRPRVLIIGAGISGIAAANALSKAGFTDFAVLEATDRIGGRIHSIDIGKNVVHDV